MKQYIFRHHTTSSGTIYNHNKLKYSERFELITKDSCHKLVEYNIQGRWSTE